MGRPPDVGVFVARDDYVLGESLVHRLTVRRRRGEHGAIRIHRVDQGSTYPHHPLPRVLIILLDGAAALPEQVTLMQRQAERSAEEWRARRPAQAAMLQSGSHRMVLLLLHPARPLSSAVADAVSGWTILPHDGRPLLGRDDVENAWNGMLDELKAIAAELATDTEPLVVEPPGSAQAPFRVPFMRDPRFVGRAEELARIDEDLQSGEIVGLRPAVTCGGSGVGARALAIEYAYRHRASYPGGVFWATCSATMQGLDTFGRRQPFEPWGVPQDAVSIADGWHMLVMAADRPDALLIVDGADTRVEVGSFAGLACRLLVVTALHDASMRSPVIDVGPLDEEAAMAHLLPFTGDDRPLAQRASQALAGLPLALRLAAGYLGAHPEVPVTDYLARLAITTGETLLGAAVEGAFRITWESLSGTRAGTLLQAMALLGRGPAPPARLALLTQVGSGQDGLAVVEEAVSRLVGHGLCARLVDGTVELHPRLIDLVLTTVTDPTAVGRGCAERLHAALSDVSRLADETLARGTKSVIDDLQTGIRLLGRNTYGSEVADGLRDLLEQVCAAARPDLDRPASRTRFLQQLAFGRDPFRPQQALPARSRAAELLEPQREAYLTVRRPAAPGHIPPGVAHRGGEARGAIARDGSTALIAQMNGSVVIWDARRAEAIRSVAVAPDQMHRYALAADGLICAVADNSLKRVVLWDLVARQPFHEIPVDRRETQFWSLALSANGSLLAAKTNEQNVLFVDLREPGRIRSRSLPRRRSGSPDEMAPLLSADGARIVVPLHGGSEIWVWDLARDEEWTLELPDSLRPAGRMHWTEGSSRGFVNGAITGDGRTVFTVSPWRTLVTWAVDDEGSPRVADESLHDVQGLACSADGAHVVVLTRIDPARMSMASHRWKRLSVQVLAAASGALVSELFVEEAHESHLSISPDGRYILVVGGGPLFIERVSPPVVPA